MSQSYPKKLGTAIVKAWQQHCLALLGTLDHCRSFPTNKLKMDMETGKKTGDDTDNLKPNLKTDKTMDMIVKKTDKKPKTDKKLTIKKRPAAPSSVSTASRSSWMDPGPSVGSMQAKDSFSTTIVQAAKHARTRMSWMDPKPASESFVPDYHERASSAHLSDSVSKSQDGPKSWMTPPR